MEKQAIIDGKYLLDWFVSLGLLMCAPMPFMLMKLKTHLGVKRYGALYTVQQITKRITEVKQTSRLQTPSTNTVWKINPNKRGIPAATK